MQLKLKTALCSLILMIVIFFMHLNFNTLVLKDITVFKDRFCITSIDSSGVLGNTNLLPCKAFMC